MRSAPTSLGLSVRIGTPVFVPGSTITTGISWKKDDNIGRNSCSTLGTVLQSTNPVISGCSSNRPRNVNAISSPVARACVVIRHDRTSSSPVNRPRTVFVFPTSTASSISSPH